MALTRLARVEISMELALDPGKHDKQTKQTDLNYPQHRALQVAHPRRAASLICGAANWVGRASNPEPTPKAFGAALTDVVTPVSLLCHSQAASSFPITSYFPQP